MKVMINKYKRGVPVILILCICLNITGYAQTFVPDSAQTKTDRVRHIAFGSQPAWMVSGAISSISGEELTRTSVTNFSNILAGRIPGLTVRQSNGEPGYDSPTLNIRGLNTFGSGSDIFILVDGFEATMEQLIPAEVESVTLLKDASATAMYGNRAANGILMVTTKRGIPGPLKVGFTAQHGFQSATRVPEFLGSYDYARLYNEGLMNDGHAEQYTTEDLAAYQSGNDPLLHPDVDWRSEIMRKSAPYYNYGMTFTGGNNTVRYFGMLNYLNSDGLMIKAGDMSDFSRNSKYSRYNFRTNIDVDVSKNLSATFIIGGTVEDKTNPGTYETTGELLTLASTIPPNAFPVRVLDDGAFGGSNIYTNPLGDVLNTGYYGSNGRSATATVRLTEKLDFITEGLSISAALAFNSFFRSYGYKTRTYKRFAVSQDAEDNIIYTGIGQETSLSGNESRSNQWRNYGFQTFLNYDRSFGNHTVDALFMTNMDEYVVTGNQLSYKNAGVAGRMTYTNSRKYITEFSFGYNGTENFLEGSRMGFFPAGSLGWIVSNEGFLEGNSTISYLKLRGSYGLVGNADIGGTRYMYEQYWGGVGSYYLGTTNASRSTTTQSTIANPDVTWEREKKLNIGFEATLVDRLDIGFDFFNNKRTHILAKPNLTIPAYLGATLPDQNVGEVSNRGFEAMLRFNSKSEGSLQWYVEANVWYAKNSIDYNAEALQINEYLYRTGNPINQPLLLEAIGFFEDATDIANSPRQIFTNVEPGDIKYKDQNGDNVVDQDDYYPIGNSTLPELTAGLHGGLRYAGFDLDVFFHGVTNRSVYWDGIYFHAFQNNAKISSIALGRWTEETAGSATYPRLSASNNINNFQPSSFWQKDGSYIKLRSLELGYTLPKALVERVKVAGARAFVNGTNLFSLDRMEKFTDPEILTGYPTVRTITLGIRLQM